MDAEDRYLIGLTLFLTFASLTATWVMCAAIMIPIFLLPMDCMSYRSFPAGAGEMQYCILDPEDANFSFSFYNPEDNKVRKDSHSYVVRPPVIFEQVTTKITESFKETPFSRTHFTFPGDFVRGTVKCNDQCTVTVTSNYNSCGSPFSERFNNKTKISFVGLVGGKGCGLHPYTLYEQTASGQFSFRAQVDKEAPLLISVSKPRGGVNPTGTIDYAVTRSRIDVSKAIRKCNSYPCDFSNLPAERKEQYVAVNIFSDDMVGEYKIEGPYLQDKEELTWASIGIGIATGVFVIATVIILIPCLKCRKEADNPQSEKKVEMNPTPGN